MPVSNSREGDKKFVKRETRQVFVNFLTGEKLAFVKGVNFLTGEKLAIWQILPVSSFKRIS